MSHYHLSVAIYEDTYLLGWAYLTHRGRRNRRAREAFLAKHGERDAKLQAQVDLWLIKHGLVDWL